MNKTGSIQTKRNEIYNSFCIFLTTLRWTLSLEHSFVKSRISVVKIGKFVGGNLYHFRCLQVQLQFSWFIRSVGCKQ